MTQEDKIRSAITSHISAADALSAQWENIEGIAVVALEVLRRGGKILLCGNGGSAADSQHIAAELVGRFKRERRALPALSLTTDTSILTCLANDYSYEKIFERQVEAHGRQGDLLIAISTSGNSPNILNAVKKAEELGLRTVGFLGRDGGLIKPCCELSLVIPEQETARVQEMHILAAHIICDLVESAITED